MSLNCQHGDILKSLNSPFLSHGHGDYDQQIPHLSADLPTPRMTRSNESNDEWHIPYKPSFNLLSPCSAHRVSFPSSSEMRTNLHYSQPPDSPGDLVFSMRGGREGEHKGDEYGDPVLAGQDSAKLNKDMDGERRDGGISLTVSRTRLAMPIHDITYNTKIDSKTRDRDGDKATSLVLSSRSSISSTLALNNQSLGPRLVPPPPSLGINTAPSSPTHFHFGRGAIVRQQQGHSSSRNQEQDQDQGQGRQSPPIRKRGLTRRHRPTVSSGSPTSETGTLGYGYEYGYHHRQRPSVSSYINLDAAGGIGDSPMPVSSILVGQEPLQLGGGGSGFGFGFGFGSPQKSRQRLAKEARATTTIGEGREGKDESLRCRSSLVSLLGPTHKLLKKLSKLGLSSNSGSGSVSMLNAELGETGAGVGVGRRLSTGLSAAREVSSLRSEGFGLMSHSHLQLPSSESRTSLRLHLPPPHPNLRKSKDGYTGNGEEESLYHSHSLTHSNSNSWSNSQSQQPPPQAQAQAQAQARPQEQRQPHTTHIHVHPIALTLSQSHSQSHPHSHSHSHSQSTSTSTAATSVIPSTLPTSTTAASSFPSNSKPSLSSLGFPVHEDASHNNGGSNNNDHNIPGLGYEEDDDRGEYGGTYYDALVMGSIGSDGHDGSRGGNYALQMSSVSTGSGSSSLDPHQPRHQHYQQRQHPAVQSRHPYVCAYDVPSRDNTADKMGAGAGASGTTVAGERSETAPRVKGTGLWTWTRRLSPVLSGPSVSSVWAGGTGGTGATGGTTDAGPGGIGIIGGGRAFRNSMSTPDLRQGGSGNGDAGGGLGGNNGGEKGDENWDGIRLRPHARARLASQGILVGRRKDEEKGKGKEEKERGRWLSTNSPYAILLPRPRFKMQTLDMPGDSRGTGGGGGSGGGAGLLSSGWEGGKAKDKGKDRKLGLLNRFHSRSLLDLVSGIGGGSLVDHTIDGTSGGEDGGESSRGLAEFGVHRVGGHQEQKSRIGKARAEPTTTTTAVNEARLRSYAQDDLSLLSLDRVLEEHERLEQDRRRWQAQATKSLGNKQSRTVSRSRSKSLTYAGQKIGAKGHGQRKQSSMDYLAARACLGNQGISPLVTYDEGGTWLQQQQQQAQKAKAIKHLQDPGERHEQKPSGNSGNSGPAFVPPHRGKGHVRNDSWGRTALRLAKSLPQMCGLVQDSNEQLKVQSGDCDHRKKQKRDGREAGPVGLEEALRRNDTKVIKLADPAAEQRALDPSPVPSGVSDHFVGIAISTPYSIPGHPYTLDADRPRYDYSRVEVSEFPPVHDPEQSFDAQLWFPRHPYAQGGLPLGGNPIYAGPHPTSVASNPLASLGLSEVSARHRLPPQIVLGQQQQQQQHQSPWRQGSQLQDQAQSQPEQQRPRPRPLYSKVDNRNSYQDLSPYIRVDSDVAPHEKLWVAFSPGTVREVLPTEVMQYSPYVAVGEVGSREGTSSSTSASQRMQEDEFLQKYQRMSMVYQDTASMSEALADAMYGAFDGRGSMIAERSYSETGSGGYDRVDVADADVQGREGEEDCSSPARDVSQDPSSSDPYGICPLPRPYHNRGELPPVAQQGSDSGSIQAFRSSQLLPDLSPIEYRSAGMRSMSEIMSNETSAYTSPVLPTAPRIGSPDNLEPFRNLFYKPPFENETSSQSSLADPCDGDPSQLVENVPWDVGSSTSQRMASELTSLAQQLSDELEQIALEQQRTSSQYSSDSMPDIPLRTSSLTTHGGSTQGSHINWETDPLHFVFGNSAAQDSNRRAYVTRPGRFSTFQSENTIPEDVEPSQASSIVEGTAENLEEDTVRYPIVTMEPSATVAPQTNYDDSEIQEIPRTPEVHHNEGLASPRLQGSSGALRSSYLTSSSFSRVSTLSEFPLPPDMI